MRLVLVAALASGCVRADRVALASATATIVCDWGQTRAAASAGWVVGGVLKEETNPMLGLRPPPHVVDIYFASAVFANALLWYVTPAKWRAAAPFALTAYQLAIPIRENVTHTDTVCGF